VVQCGRFVLGTDVFTILVCAWHCGVKDGLNGFPGLVRISRGEYCDIIIAVIISILIVT